MENSDHISLMLPVSEFSAEHSKIILQLPTRKSLRRSWNQLPRLQRSLIILGLTAVCLILLQFLPGDAISTENGESYSVNNGLPLHINQKADGGIKVLTAHNKLGDIDLKKHVADSAKSDIEQIKKLNVRSAHFLSQGENVVEIPTPQLQPQLQKQDYDQLAVEQNRIDIAETNGNSNNIEAPGVMQDDNRQTLESAIQDPGKMPGFSDITIDDFVNRLETTDAQKQHFHGATNDRQAAVVAAFKHSWAGYKRYAWGHDNLKPISQGSHDWFGLGLTIVDSLDTMYIMGLEDEFTEARDWVNEFLTFENNREVNLFEVTIRVLGGLLASYHLSGDKMFLKKSVELGNRLLPCFLSPSGIPYSDANLAALSAHSPKWSPDSSTSEVTTIQLEFRDLSRSSNTPMYERVVNIVNEKIHMLEKNNGLVPIFINANTGTFRNYATVSLGARGDSYYEYLLKQWLQTGRKGDDDLILDYVRAIDGVLTQLMRRTPKEHHVYIGELIHGKEFKPKMDHLTCYLPGTLLLGHKYGMPDSHLILAKDLLDTCYQTYIKQPTHLAPEISYFAVNDYEEHDIYVKPNDAHNLLRPEFIESLYYFYALTGNRTYQDMGWNIFQAFEKHSKVVSGYSSIGNVKSVFNAKLRDMMESFWLSETLKYFYLLFSDNRKEIDLDKWIFNTEAHPLPMRNN